jgi:outer membrane lipoprotein SlyB
MYYPTILLLTLSLSLASCESKAGTGALAGAGVGAVGGGLIAGSGTGVLIGGAVGATTGAIIGASLDDSDRRSLEKQSPRTLKKIDNGEQLSIDDIKKMSRAGISDDVIVSQIAATKSVFYLSTADIVDLKKSGVSQRVINDMVQTGNQ